MVRLGGPVFFEESKGAGAGQSHGAMGADPELLAAKHKEKGFTSAYVPQIDYRDGDMVRATRKAFQRENIILAESGYWENMMDTDDATRKYHRDKMLDAYYLAEELG